MRNLLFVAASFFIVATSNARSPLDPTNTEFVLLESYVHYFNVKEIFQQCETLSPEQAPSFKKAFLVWEERNRPNWLFVNEALAKHFESKPNELKELINAAPDIMKEQYQASPYNPTMCMNALASINTVRLWDYSVDLQEHMKILELKFKKSDLNSAVNKDAAQ